jgi:hypothetical protein
MFGLIVQRWPAGRRHVDMSTSRLWNVAGLALTGVVLAGCTTHITGAAAPQGPRPPVAAPVVVGTREALLTATPTSVAPAPLPHPNVQPTGHIELMTCDGPTVTAVVIDAASGRTTSEHTFPLHGGFTSHEGAAADVQTDSSYNCYADTNVPPQGRRWMFNRDFTRVAATTVIGFDQVQYTISINTHGDPEQYAMVTGNDTGWADPPLFNSAGTIQWRLDVPFGINAGQYTPGHVAVWTSPVAHAMPHPGRQVPRTGPDRIRPYFLDTDGHTPVWLADSTDLDDLVPGNPTVDGWASPDRSFTASWSGAQNSAQLSITDAAGRSTGYSPVDCLPTAWLDNHRLLCTGSVLSDTATGVDIIELSSGPGGPSFTTTALRQTSGVVGGLMPTRANISTTQHPRPTGGRSPFSAAHARIQCSTYSTPTAELSCARSRLPKAAGEDSAGLDRAVRARCIPALLIPNPSAALVTRPTSERVISARAATGIAQPSLQPIPPVPGVLPSRRGTARSTTTAPALLVRPEPVCARRRRPACHRPG